jgi:hypothetical protein
VNLYKIVGWVGIALAVITAFVNVPYGGLLMAIAGGVVAFSIAGEHHVRVIVSALALHMIADAFNGLPGIGPAITHILSNFGTVAAGAALLIIVRNVYERFKP